MSTASRTFLRQQGASWGHASWLFLFVSFLAPSCGAPYRPEVGVEELRERRERALHAQIETF